MILGALSTSKSDSTSVLPTAMAVLLTNFLLEYIHCMGGIHSDNSDYTYIIHWLARPHRLSPSPPIPTPLKAIARGFLAQFHIGI
jgi:hypothetical protein